MSTEFRLAMPQCCRANPALAAWIACSVVACARPAEAPVEPPRETWRLPRCDESIALRVGGAVVATTPAEARGEGWRSERPVAIAFTWPDVVVAQAALPCARDDDDPRSVERAAQGLVRERAREAALDAARACLDAFDAAQLRDATAAREQAPCGAHHDAPALWGIRLRSDGAFRVSGDRAWLRVQAHDAATGTLAGTVPLRLSRDAEGWRADGDALARDARAAVERARSEAAWFRRPPPPPASPPVMAVGDEVRGAIEPDDPRMSRPAPERLSSPLGLPAAYDVFEVHAPAGRTIEVQVDGIDGFDPLLAVAPRELLDLAELPDGWWQDDRDIDRGDLGATVAFRVDEAGRYRVYVTQPIAGDFGRYVLRSRWR